MKKCWIIILLSSLAVFILLKSVYAGQITRYDSLIVDTVSDRIFAARQDDKGVDVIEMQTGEAKTILSGKRIKTMALDVKDGTLAAIDGYEFHIVSTETFDILASIPIEGEATSLAIDPEAGLAVFTQAEGKVVFIDLNAYVVLSEIETPDKPISVAVDPQLHLALVVHDTWGNGNDGERDNITIIDLATRSMIKTLQAGKNPVEAAVNSVIHKAAVANEKSNDLTLIDLTTLSVEENIEVGKHPKSLSFNECLNTLSVVGGEDKGWIQVVDIDSRHIDAHYDLDDKPEIIRVHQYLNEAVISGRGGLITMDLPNPVPQLISIAPEKALRGERSFGFSLSGKGLLEITGLYLNGNETGSTLSGCGAINMYVPPEYLQKTGSIEIGAKNPLPGGGTSSPVYLDVENPVPTISGLDPMEMTAGAPALDVTGYGRGFFDDTALYIDGISRPFTCDDQSVIHIRLDAEDMESGKYIEITASNPEPGGGTSSQAVFTVINPVPELTVIEPSTIIAGKTDFDLTLTGGNFVKTSIVSLNNQQYPARYVSRTRLEATIPADAIKTPGNYPVKVFNPAPGGGETETHMLNVKPPIEVEITSPADGDTVNQAKTLVKGTIKSDTDDVGVLVNGVLAELQGKDWVVSVPLVTGTNAIMAKITDGAGNFATSAINVNAVNTVQRVRLTASLTSGTVPLTTCFSATTEMLEPVATYQVDFEGDGVIDYTGATFEDVSHAYTTEGFFYPTIAVTDNEGNTYSDTIAISVIEKEQLDTLLKAKWEGLKKALKNKETEAALGYFIGSSRERYRSVFVALKDQLPAILDTFEELNITDYYDGIAEYEIVADENGVLYSYPGLFVKDVSGIWKFRDF